MSAEFFNRKLDVNQTVTPLVAAPELCFYECINLDDEYTLACRDAILSAGSVQVVTCLNYNSNDCNARRHTVGNLNSEQLVEINPSFQIERSVNELVAKELGVDPVDLQELADERSGIKAFAEAIAEFGLRRLEE